MKMCIRSLLIAGKALTGTDGELTSLPVWSSRLPPRAWYCAVLASTLVLIPDLIDITLKTTREILKKSVYIQHN